MILLLFYNPLIVEALEALGSNLLVYLPFFSAQAMGQVKGFSWQSCYGILDTSRIGLFFLFLTSLPNYCSMEANFRKEQFHVLDIQQVPQRICSYIIQSGRKGIYRFSSVWYEAVAWLRRGFTKVT